MSPLGFASIPAGVPAASRPWRAGPAVAQESPQPFAAQYQSAKAGASEDDNSEVADRKPVPVRKSSADPKQSADPKSARPDAQVAPVQTVVAQQPQDQPSARVLSISLSPGVVSLGSLFGNFSVTGVSAADSTPQDIPQAGSQAVSQLAPALPPIAFSLNLQKSEPSDQKPTGPASPIGPTGQQQNTSPPVTLAASAGENPPSDTGSDQSAPQGDHLADPKPALASVSKQDAASVDSPVVAGSAAAPVQALVSTATHSTTGSVPKQSSTAPVADASPAPPPEQALPSAPAPSRQFDLTVPNDAGHPVDIRISQRGEDVQVTVRTPDGILAQSLRHNLSELSENLSKTGLREEVLHTAQSHSPGDADSGERDRGETPQRDDSQQSRHASQERSRPAAKEQSNNQQAKSFAEAIRVQERII